MSGENIKLIDKLCPVQEPNMYCLDEIEVEDKKEFLGEIIYPLAKRMYQTHAPKLTGMVIDAILKLQTDELIKEAITSKSIIDELVSNFLYFK